MHRHISRLARAYFKLLSSVDWADPVLVKGLQEGLNKFLSNAHLSLVPGVNKYHKTHYISRAALAQARGGTYRGLVWEHLVPKHQYIQQPCQRAAREGQLTIPFIENLLQRYWCLATITREEDRILSTTTMPDEWDTVDVFARYAAAGIELVPNPFLPALCEVTTEDGERIAGEPPQSPFAREPRERVR